MLLTLFLVLLFFSIIRDTSILLLIFLGNSRGLSFIIILLMQNY
jgi:hypothetical protein